MDELYSFFSHLILVSAGLVVCLLWFALIGAVVIEIWDNFTEKSITDDEEENY